MKIKMYPFPQVSFSNRPNNDGKKDTEPKDDQDIFDTWIDIDWEAVRKINKTTK